MCNTTTATSRKRTKCETMQDGESDATILGIGSAFPGLYSQDEVRDAIASNYKFTSDTLDFMHRVFKGTGFDSCAMASTPEQLGKRMTRTEYVKYIKSNLKKLAAQAATDAVESWGGDFSDITHIVFGTMTQSIHAPTMDVELVLHLGLPMTTKRLNVEGMGCLTGFRCLALGATIAEADPSARVLVVCADIRSALINQMPEYPTRKHLVTAALFRDSAGAVIMGQCPAQTTAKSSSGSERPLYAVRGHESLLIPDSFDVVSLTENDSSDILLDLSKDIPKVVSKHVRPLVDRLAEGYEVDIGEAEFALHTGGPRVIKEIADALGMSDDGQRNMSATWEVMKKYGNLSGSSNLVVLHHILKKECGELEANPLVTTTTERPEGKHVLCISMGPGMAIEGLLLERCCSMTGVESHNAIMKEV